MFNEYLRTAFHDMVVCHHITVFGYEKSSASAVAPATDPEKKGCSESAKHIQSVHKKWVLS
jgi:hypothetical protein